MSLYPRVTSDPSGQTPASPRFPQIEERVLSYWEADNTFQASIDQRAAGENEFVFYDGPPFANGLPHYGHLLTGYVKDLVARYQTQRGRRVERRFGWDTHGLPAELEAMKQLGMTDKKQILEMGIDKFNAACRSSVLKYTGEWQNYVTRQARWVDFENDYKTLNPSFMESVLWAFSELHRKGLTYEGFRVLPYCWKDETPLSNHELRMDDDVYKDRQDTTVTVSFPLLTGESELSKELAGVNVLAWTTTPWTLPTNLALAVGPAVQYSVLPGGPEQPASNTVAAGARYLLASELVGAHAKDLGYADASAAQEAVTATYTGTELDGLRYAPLWDVFNDAEKWGTQGAWRIVVDEYVSTTDGTGVVHQAPAYGEDDQRVCEANGIPVVLSVDEGARFLPLFENTVLADVAGVQVFEANKALINHLKADGRLLRQASYVHSYPHCWRCRTPLIYRAVSSWYVQVTDVKARMGELNQGINWIPENVKDGQFGKWVANARDWSISRNRFWGSPIPVWQCSDAECQHEEVHGSLEELKARFGRLPVNHEGETDLHRPFIDELTTACPEQGCTGTLRRVEDVLDVWFDSGSMPYAQVHYPMENKEWFDTHNPADFIVEYIGQTRGWFYTMHILATALFDRPAFKNVISHGIVLGSDGQKMSKSLRNYPDVNEVLDRDGSDAMRWFLMASPILRGGNLVVTEEGIREGVRQVLLPLWNVWYFFTLYTNSADGGRGYEAQLRYDAKDPLDRYLLAATGDLVREVRVALDSYEVSDATDALRSYMDTLTNWYVRRSRQRFFDEDHEAFDVLYTALETLCRVAAPLLPLATEEIWRGLTGGRSVHLSDYPDDSLFPVDAALVERMALTRTIASTGSSLRKAAKLRVRLPLASMDVVVPDAAGLSGTFADIIKDELNLKAVHLVDAEGADEASFGISRTLTVNARAAGPRLGKQVQQAIKGSKSGDWSVAEDGSVRAGGLDLVEGEYTLTTVVDDAGSGRAAAVLSAGGFVVLDTALTPELEAEGTARDLVRAIQSARKAANLTVGDRIRTSVQARQDVVDAAQTHRELVTAETLSSELELLVADLDEPAVVVEAVASDAAGVQA
ncbi:isoleucine--tRNA ligase [Galactobacter caseinivorans]|uniref:Isoleucine--tRNA ligase n=1 Tax=Galactobacter caseinivorans TaxID=2676123 RepID=A0A496PH18_9MICC|nr:isoleucine--tRNA ligase [Galactobacter caseinivorans]RKW69769.1 isoleucine--tRNA ligase [Galactobacter caseinivorans]